MLQIAIALQNFFQIAGFSHAMLELMQLVFELLQMAESRERRLVHGRTRFEVNVLGEQPQFQAARAHHFAAIRRGFIIDQAKDRRLAGAVAPDQPDVISRIDLQRCAAQNVLRAVGFVYVGKAKQHD